MAPMLENHFVLCKRYRNSRSVPECGGKRSATPLRRSPRSPSHPRAPLHPNPSGEHLTARLTLRPHESGVADALRDATAPFVTSPAAKPITATKSPSAQKGRDTAPAEGPMHGIFTFHGFQPRHETVRYWLVSTSHPKHVRAEAPLVEWAWSAGAGLGRSRPRTRVSAPFLRLSAAG
jgi:hypothetical protein